MTSPSRLERDLGEQLACALTDYTKMAILGTPFLILGFAGDSRVPKCGGTLLGAGAPGRGAWLGGPREREITGCGYTIECA